MSLLNAYSTLFLSHPAQIVLTKAVGSKAALHERAAIAAAAAEEAVAAGDIRTNVGKVFEVRNKRMSRLMIVWVMLDDCG